MKYGRLTVIEFADVKGGNKRYLCLCDCGNKKVIAGTSLRTGATKSCGCLNLEKKRTRDNVHGLHGTKIHKSWSAMIQRCTNPNNPKYYRYGGRGITVCERWKKFKNFLEDMGIPKQHLSLDRIDNNGNYEPSNCRWASSLVQGNNRYY